LSATLMGSTHSGTPSPRWAMIEDYVEEFLMASSGEGGFGLPSPRRCDMGASPAPDTTTAWTENTSATQAMTTVPPRTAAPRPNTGLPFKQRCAHQGVGNRCEPMLSGKSMSKRHYHGEASSSTSKPLPRSSHPRHHDTSPHSRGRRS
jgi:hypothetical protein